MTILEQGMNKLNICVDNNQMKLIEIYLNELEFWKKRNIVNAEGDDLIIRHFLDSMAAFSLFPETAGNKWADFGSGAGFPGLLLSIFFPEKEMYLVERQASRSAFLTSCISLMGLKERVVCLEQECEKINEKFDLIMFRAFRPMEKIHKMLKKRIDHGAVIAAYKGTRQKVNQDLALFNDYHCSVLPVCVPFLDEERHLLIISGYSK